MYSSKNLIFDSFSVFLLENFDAFFNVSTAVGYVWYDFLQKYSELPFL